MGDLIDRDATCAHIKYLFDGIDVKALVPVQTIIAVIFSAINCDAPAVDAVPVVRCGDCKFCSRFRNSLICDKHTDLDTFYVAPDFYCADGKRRDGGEQQCD